MKKLLFLIPFLFIVNSCVVFKEQIPIYQTDNKMLYVELEMNRVLKIPALIDTGCTTTSIPIEVFLTLKETGTVVKEDLLDSRTYVLADGSEIECPRFLLKELRIGTKRFKNVEVSITLTPNSPILLGSNVLEQFGSVAMDYKRSKLIVLSN